MKDIESLRHFDVAEQLMIWKDTFCDPMNDFDARLLQRAADLLIDSGGEFSALQDEVDSLIAEVARLREKNWRRLTGDIEGV